MSVAILDTKDTASNKTKSLTPEKLHSERQTTPTNTDDTWG